MIPRNELEPSSYRVDCTHFVIDNLGLVLPKDEVPGDFLDDFVSSLPGSENGQGVCVVRYNQRPYLRHWGLAVGERVISKWGRGPILEHDIDEVPELWKTPYGAVKFKLPDEYHPRVLALFGRR